MGQSIKRTIERLILCDHVFLKTLTFNIICFTRHPPPSTWTKPRSLPEWEATSLALFSMTISTNRPATTVVYDADPWREGFYIIAPPPNYVSSGRTQQDFNSYLIGARTLALNAGRGTLYIWIYIQFGWFNSLAVWQLFKCSRNGLCFYWVAVRLFSADVLEMRF